MFIVGCIKLEKCVSFGKQLLDDVTVAVVFAIEEVAIEFVAVLEDDGGEEYSALIVRYLVCCEYTSHFNYSSLGFRQF